MALHSELWFPSVIWSGMVHVVDNTEFKKWAYTKVQRPVNDYVRAKTGERIFKSPHLIPFKRKYGFEIEPTLSDIKKEQIESVVYRWRHYNKIDFHEEFVKQKFALQDLLIAE